MILRHTREHAAAGMLEEQRLGRTKEQTSVRRWDVRLYIVGRSDCHSVHLRRGRSETEGGGASAGWSATETLRIIDQHSLKIHFTIIWHMLQRFF